MNTIKGDFAIELVRENEDGSAVYVFNYPPDAFKHIAEEAYKRAMRDAVGLLKTQHELVKQRHNYYRHAANLIHLEFLEEDDER